MRHPCFDCNMMIRDFSTNHYRHHSVTHSAISVEAVCANTNSSQRWIRSAWTSRHHPSQIRLLIWCMEKPFDHSWSLSVKQILIGLGGCPGWFEIFLSLWETVVFVMSGLVSYTVDLYFAKWYLQSTAAIFRSLDKRAQSKIIFLISQRIHLLWILKRTISTRRFFWATKTYT